MGEKIWRENPQEKESPTVGTVVIHSTDDILDIEIYRLVIRHVSAWGALGPRPAFMASVGFNSHPFSVCENGNVFFGDTLLPYLKAESEGLTILQKAVDKLNEVHERLVSKSLATNKSNVVPRKPLAAFAEELLTAYSSGEYAGGWGPCIKALRKRNYTDSQIEAILRSKWARWAADRVHPRKASAKALLAWMDDPRNEVTEQTVRKLTLDTFSGNLEKALAQHA